MRNKIFRVSLAIVIFLMVSIVWTSNSIKTAEAFSRNPSTIIIPTIKVSAKIKAMGLTNDKKMDVPDNYKEVGWLSYGDFPAPGEIGNAVLGAHVDNGSSRPTIDGVFKNINKLAPGDDIYVTRENSVLHFKVTKTKIYDYDSTSTNEIFGISDRVSMNLITCYGKWQKKIGTYDKRLIVFTDLVKEYRI